MPVWKLTISSLCLALLLGAASSTTSSAFAQDGQRKSERLVRIVWQDPEKNTILWGDLVQVGPKMLLQQGGTVENFPSLDSENQHLVQMDRVEDVLLVGVRDNDNGQFQSGWVAVDLGVDEMPHGDHSDYEYRNHPRVLASKLDAAQGNPAHLYVYDDQFYLANDKLNGMTRLDPKNLRGPVEGRKGTFHRGGGSHITLAAIDNTIAYSTWSGREKEVQGKIDVVNLARQAEDAIAYSFQLPVGGLHGAIANSGRIFFAPADGIYWLDADLAFQKTAETVQPRHLSLGKVADGERPLRTGAFLNHGNWVLFNTGRQDDSALCLVDASAAEPKLVKVAIKPADGLSLVTPATVFASSGKRYAFVFQGKQSGDVAEKLTIVDLDPNGDRDFSDAAIAKTLEVGPSNPQGHNGRHAITFDDDARFGILAIPGSGEIWVLSLESLTIVGKYKVGGTPIKILAVGGEESKH